MPAVLEDRLDQELVLPGEAADEHDDAPALGGGEGTLLGTAEVSWPGVEAGEAFQAAAFFGERAAGACGHGLPRVPTRALDVCAVSAPAE